MIPLIGALLSAISNAIPSLFTYLGKKQDVSLDGFKTATGIDLQAYQAYLAANNQANQLKAAANVWLGARMIAFGAGELCVLYFGAIVLDSVFHLDWRIAKLPAPWDANAWVILQSFILVSPTLPAFSALASWLGRK